MGRIAAMLKTVPELPTGGFVKIARLLEKRALLSSLEKTAATRDVAAKLRQRDGEILAAFYKEAASLEKKDEPSPHVKVAHAMIAAGAELYAAATLRDPDPSVFPALEKLATAGVVNYRLALALSEEALSDEGREAAFKLASENNAAMLDLLAELGLTKEADSPGASMSKSFMSSGKPSGLIGSVGDMISSAGSAIKGAVHGTLGKTVNSGGAAAVDKGGIPPSAVASGYRNSSK